MLICTQVLAFALATPTRRRAVRGRTSALGAGVYGTIARRYTQLGLTAFGGPQAHVALMLAQKWREELVDEETFVSLYALTQYMPGPSSTQLVVALGTLQGGWQGGLLAFLCFSTPAALVMGTAGSALSELPSAPVAVAAQAGLGAAAVALVAKAAYMLSRKCAPDPLTQAVCIATAATAMLTKSALVFPTLLTLGAIVAAAAGARAPCRSLDQVSTVRVPLGRASAAAIGALWLGLLVGLSVSAKTRGGLVDLSTIFYRTGSLIYGGGQVVLPLLLRETVPKWLTEQHFVNGFALVQAMPGPMFNLSAFLGATARGPLGAVCAWASLFLPGILLIWAALPFWAQLRASPRARDALRGVNAAASGLVIAATFLLAQKAASTIELQVVGLITFAAAQLFGVNPAVVVAMGAVLGVPLSRSSA